VLATFDDGSAAIVRRSYGPGVVYTLGVDFRDTILRNQLAHSLDAARADINVFEPATDTWMLMVRDIYDARVRFAVRLHTAPSGLRAAVLLTHDLDWGDSYDNAVVFATKEHDLNATATYFVHTKYVTDSQDQAFFGTERGCELLQVLAAGATVGSHSVAHSPVLDGFPIGDGSEAYPSYQPYNVSPVETDNGTLFGELRVSKSLIDGLLGAFGTPHDTISFRPGELSYHKASPQTMERLGYRYDSARSPGDVLTNFPYRAMTDWPDGFDTSVYEFPIEVEDELAPRFDMRADATLAIVAANANNGAPTNILIHPNVTDYKLAAEVDVLSRLPPGVGAMGLDPFAEFWRGRDHVEVTAIDFDDVAHQLTVTLIAHEAVTGLTLRVSSVVDGAMPPATFIAQANGAFVALPPLAQDEEMAVVMTYR
jgi:hypothetical protein